MSSHGNEGVYLAKSSFKLITTPSASTVYRYGSMKARKRMGRCRVGSLFLFLPAPLYSLDRVGSHMVSQIIHSDTDQNGTWTCCIKVRVTGRKPRLRGMYVGTHIHLVCRSVSASTGCSFAFPPQTEQDLLHPCQIRCTRPRPSDGLALRVLQVQ